MIHRKPQQTDIQQGYSLNTNSGSKLHSIMYRWATDFRERHGVEFETPLLLDYKNISIQNRSNNEQRRGRRICFKNKTDIVYMCALRESFHGFKVKTINSIISAFLSMLIFHLSCIIMHINEHVVVMTSVVLFLYVRLRVMHLL